MGEYVNGSGSGQFEMPLEKLLGEDEETIRMVATHAEI
jgi:hypothetical protein